MVSPHRHLRSDTQQHTHQMAAGPPTPTVHVALRLLHFRVKIHGKFLQVGSGRHGSKMVQGNPVFVAHATFIELQRKLRGNASD